MTDLTETLAAIRELHENDYDGGHPYTPRDPYVNAHKTAGKLLAAVEAVLDKARSMTVYAESTEYWGGVRAAGDEILAALTQALEGMPKINEIKEKN